MNHSLRARKTLNGFRIPENLSLSRQLQGRSCFEVDEQQPGARIDREISESIEHIITHIVGKSQ